MNGFNQNIEKLTLANEDFRRVLYTAKFSQLVLMSLNPAQEIGEEIHDVDQFFRFEKGQGRAVIDGTEHMVADGSAVIVPAGAKHNIINVSNSEALKFYTIYMPPHHKDGTVHPTKAAAQLQEEHFDGKTTE